MRSFLVFLVVQLTIVAFVFPAYAGGCTPGVIKAMKEVGLSDKDIMEICELAIEFDRSLSKDSYGPADDVLIEAIRVSETKRGLNIKKVNILNKLSVGKECQVKADLTCIGSNGKIYNKVRTYWFANREGKWVIYNRTL